MTNIVPDSITTDEACISFDIVSPEASFCISSDDTIALDGYGEWDDIDINTSDIPIFFCSTDHWAAEHARIYAIDATAQDAFESGELYCFQGPDHGRFVPSDEVDPACVAHEGRTYMGQTHIAGDFFDSMECMEMADGCGEPLAIYFAIGD